MDQRGAAQAMAEPALGLRHRVQGEALDAQHQHARRPHDAVCRVLRRRSASLAFADHGFRREVGGQQVLHAHRAAATWQWQVQAQQRRLRTAECGS